MSARNYWAGNMTGNRTYWDPGWTWKIYCGSGIPGTGKRICWGPVTIYVGWAECYEAKFTEDLEYGR